MNHPNVQGYSSADSKKPYLAKFEQTHDWQIWGYYIIKTPNFGFWSAFRGLIRASETIIWKSEKYVRGYIHLEFPKNLVWPNLNKPATGKFGATMPPKPHFLGSGPFSEASFGPQTQFFGKVKYDPLLWCQVFSYTFTGRIDHI